MTKTAVLLSRHPLTPAQRKNLPGYVVHQVHPPSRYWSADDALAMAQSANGGLYPDLFIVVMPVGMLRRFLWLIGGRVPVIRARFDFSCEPPRFVRWERVTDVQVIYSEWTAEYEHA